MGVCVWEQMLAALNVICTIARHVCGMIIWQAVASSANMTVHMNVCECLRVLAASASAALPQRNWDNLLAYLLICQHSLLSLAA